jgi:membrane-bound inhibitor of C-type lysozyme
MKKGEEMKAVWVLTASAMALVALLPAQAAVAAPLTVPQVQISTINTLRYLCGGRKVLTVQYMNTKNRQSFALLTIDGRKVLFVNVMSGSGAKYVGDHYTWWTRGPQGTLSDDMADPNAAPLLADCKAGG